MRELIKKLLKEGLITETSIENITLKDFNVKYILDRWLGSPSSVVNNFKFEMQDDYYLTSDEKDEIMNSDEYEIIESTRFLEWVKYEVEYKIEDVIDNLKRIIDINNRILIYRNMTISQEWLENIIHSGNRLGKYWSFDKNSAESHWGGNHEYTIRITSIINEEYVDWVETVEANIDPNLGEDEKEITLFKNTPLKILSLEIKKNGGEFKEYDKPGLKNKIFKA